MAQNFNEMTKEELEAVLNSDSIIKMNAAELNQLRKAVKAAGLLSVQYDNMLGIAINNRTYEEIKNSNDYTEEEKALALETRNEYNRKLRATTENKLYNIDEIMSRAVKVNGKYHFDELTAGEMDFLIDKKVVRRSELDVGKQYNIGQQENRNFGKEVSKDDSKMSDDVKKSAAFWNNFNQNKSNVKFVVTPLQDNTIKVDAQKDNKTVFSGIDQGNKGFDVIKKEENSEPYAIYDLIVKKAKTSNPKAKIRIKDNVKDPVLRNKILIACAKNNMEPIGNLPEGFDFAALKEMVKDAKDIATINALAENLYELSNVEVAQEQEKEDKNRVAGAVLINQGGNQQSVGTKAPEEKKDSKTTVVPLVGLGGNGNGGNNGAVPPAAPSSSNSKPVEAPKRPWWKKVRDAVVVAGIALLGMIGVRSCQNQERLEKRVKDLQEQVDNKSMTDCDEVSRLINEKYNDGYMDGLAQGLKDCEEKDKPQPKPVVKKRTTPVKKKVVEKKQEIIIPKVVKTIKVDKFPAVEEDHRLQPVPEANPYDNMPELNRYVDEDALNRTKNTPKVTSEWTHGDMYTNYNFHGDLHENYESHEVVENKDNKEVKKKNMQTAWVLSSKGQEKQ